MRSKLAVLALASMAFACERQPNALAPTSTGHLVVSVSGNIQAVPATASLGDQIAVSWNAEGQAIVEACVVSENACRAPEILSRNREGNVVHQPNQEGEWRYSLIGSLSDDTPINLGSATVRVFRRPS